MDSDNRAKHRLSVCVIAVFFLFTCVGVACGDVSKELKRISEEQGEIRRICKNCQR